MKVWSDRRRRRLYNQNGIRLLFGHTEARAVIQFYWTIIRDSNSGALRPIRMLWRGARCLVKLLGRVCIFIGSPSPEEFRLVPLIINTHTHNFCFPKLSSKMLLRTRSAEKEVVAYDPRGSARLGAWSLTVYTFYLKLAFRFLIFFVASTSCYNRLPSL